jgi:hypothetical protein
MFLGPGVEWGGVGDKAAQQATWRQHGGNMEAAWRQQGGNVETDKLKLNTLLHILQPKPWNHDTLNHGP